MTCSKKRISVAAIFFLNIEACFCMCALAEYEINGECCPMCAPGNFVYQHCTEENLTLCAPCLESTYNDEPNGLTKCRICSECSSGRDLKMKSKCTRFSNTVCEPLEGHYCTDQYRGSCVRAIEHTKCSPGQYIKHNGTTLQDTECDKCAEGYSDGTLQICQPFTKCEELGLTEVKAGTDSSDTVCGTKAIVFLKVGSSLVVFIAIGIGILLISKIILSHIQLKKIVSSEVKAMSEMEVFVDSCCSS